MAKLTLNDVTNFADNSTAVTTTSANNAAIEAFAETVLSRDGTSPNAMNADIDMNSNRIINLATPVNNSDAATKFYVDDNTGNAAQHAADAAQHAADAAESAQEAADSAADAEETLGDFQNIYYGSAASDPATRPDGSARQDGDLYKNTATANLRVFHAASGVWADSAPSSIGDGTVTYPKLDAAVADRVRDLGYILEETSNLLDAYVGLGGSLSDFPKGRIRLIDNIIRKLKAEGLWAKLDFLYFTAAHDEYAARINWKSPGDFTLSKNGTLTFNADKGYTGDGLTGYLGTGFVPSVDAAQWTLNSAHAGVWCLNDIGGVDYPIGVLNAHQGLLINPRNTTTGFVRLNDSISLSFSSSTGIGHVVVSRTGASARDAYFNSVSAANDTQSVSAMPSTEVTLLRASSTFSLRQIAAAHAGASLNGSEVKTLNLILWEYLVEIGAVYNAGDYGVDVDVLSGSIVCTPPVWAEEMKGEELTPGDVNNYFNVLLAPGSNAMDGSAQIYRSTLVGEAVGETIIEWERVDAFGSGAMRFAQYSSRNTAIGSIALQWLGASSKQHLIDTFHDFWRYDVGVPGEPGWDFMGMETRNPGIGAAISAWDDYVDNTSDVSMNLAVGRDALLHQVRGVENIGIGYQSLTNLFDGNYNVAVGVRALRDNVFGIGNTAIGRSAGAWHQEGFNNLFLGRQSGESLVKGNGNILIGYRAATSFPAEMNNMLVIQTATSDPVLAASLENGAIVSAAGMGTTLSVSSIQSLPRGFYSGIGSVMPNAAGRFSGVVTGSVASLVSTLGTGITASRSHVVFEYANGTVLGSITTSSGSTAFNTTSDRRLKTETGPVEDALALVMSVPARRYTRGDSPEEIGFFADEIKDIAPWAVTGEVDEVEEIGTITGESGQCYGSNVPKPINLDEYDEPVTWEKTGERPKFMMLDYSKVTPILWAAVRELANKLDEMEKKI